MTMLATISGARIWCADRPAAFIATTSLFWFRPTKAINVPSRTEKGRKRETSDRQAQRDVAPQIGVGVARDREDLARFAQQVERHQDQHQREQHGEAARQEQPHHVEGELARREEAEVDHAAGAGFCAARGACRVTRLAILREERVRARRSAARPGVCASTWYIQQMIAASRTQRHPQASDRIEPPVRPPICSAYWLTL